MKKKKPNLSSTPTYVPDPSSGGKRAYIDKEALTPEELHERADQAKLGLILKSKNPIKNKKRLLEDSQTKEERKVELKQIEKDGKRELKELEKFKKLDIYKMQESGEYKVIAQKIYLMATKGLSRKEIRTNLGISQNVWHQMMVSRANKFPAYKNAIDRGEMYAIEDIEESMKSRAMGYDYIEETIDGISGNVKVVRKHIPADVKAGMFILTNKKPEIYKMKRTEETVNVNITKKTIDYGKLSIDTLRELDEAGVTSKDIIDVIPTEIKEVKPNE